jgi:hypothetical protein
MKALFVVGLLVGFVGVLAGVHGYPWAAAPRLPSATSVVANGGRAERFVIRLPADRIVADGSPSTGLRAAAFPKGSAGLPAMAAPEQPVLLEQFKVRDQTGSVIGIAARHWTQTATGPATAWMLLLPGRGALMLTAPGEALGAVDAALASAGRRPGRGWSGDVEVVTADGDAARIVTGSDEFEGLTGRYKETWALTGVGADGEVQGTVTLDTVTYHGA